MRNFQKSSGQLTQSSFDYKNRIKKIKQTKNLFPNHLFIYNNINNISNNNINNNHKKSKKNNIKTVRYYNFKTEENESNNNEKISLKSTFISK